MANSKISGLTAATTPLVGTEELVLVQTGNKRIAASNVSVGALKSNATTGVMQITGPATGEIRVATVPNANFTVARTDAAQTFTGLQTFDTLTTTGNVILGNASTDTLNVGDGGLVKDASGNVGIGTTNPATTIGNGGANFGIPVQIANNGTIIGGLLSLYNNAAAGTANVASLLFSAKNAAGTAAITTAAIQNISDTSVAGSETGNITFLTRATGGSNLDAGTSERMRITSTGNVGIGTSSPSAKLTVVGTVKSASTAQSSLYLSNGAQTNGFLVGRSLGSGDTQDFFIYDTIAAATRLAIDSSGNVGIGTTTPGYQLTLSTDSAAKPSTSTWTVSSDERLKENIILADLDRCYEIVKSIPLKRYTWKDEVYTKEAVGDRSKLGWVAQDVKPLFNKAVNEHKQVLLTSTTTQEEYEEQDYTVDVVPKTTAEIKIINGIPTQIKTTVDEEVKTLLFNEVAVIDEEGNPILNENDEPLLHQVPVMVTKYRDKVVYDEIEDCLDLQVDQIYAAMYGAIQALQLKVEKLEVNKI